MIFRHFATAAASVVIACGLSGQALAQTAPATPTPPAGAASTQTTEGVVSLGASFNDVSGSLQRVGEYDPMRQSAGAGTVQLWGGDRVWQYDLFANYGGDSRDQKFSAFLRGPRVTAKVSYDRFLHRLDHDPLSYVGAAIATFVVRADDLDPSATYASTNGIWNASVDVAATENVHFFASHRMQTVTGAHQVMVTSHCSNCHISSYTRRLDETTQELAAGARLTAGRLTADYTFEHRTFKENAAALTHTFDAAVHPQTLADSFLNRVSYDARNGALPIDAVPNVTKRTNTVRAAYELPGDGLLSGNFTQSSSTNDSVGFGADYVGGSGRAVIPLGKRATLKAFFRRYDIKVDSVFVDIAEPVAPAGPSAGYTYAQYYPTLGSVDYYTESTASRTPTEVALELAFRPSKRSTVNVGYLFEQVNRHESQVSKTVTNTIKVSANSRASRALSVRGKFEYSAISDPFANLNGAKPAILQPDPTPGGVPFPGLQYFTMYRSRTVDLSSMPSSSLSADGTMTWSPNARTAVSAHYRYRNLTNDTLRGASWGHQMHMPGVDIWFAPTDRFTLSAGWGYQRDTLDTAFSTLNFVG